MVSPFHKYALAMLRWCVCKTIRRTVAALKQRIMSGGRARLGSRSGNYRSSTGTGTGMAGLGGSGMFYSREDGDGGGGGGDGSEQGSLRSGDEDAFDVVEAFDDGEWVRVGWEPTHGWVWSRVTHDILDIKNLGSHAVSRGISGSCFV